MALNEIYANGESLNYSFNFGLYAGEFVVFGENLRGVAETDAVLREDSNMHATIRHVGVFTGTSQDAFELGDPVYLASGVSFGSELTSSDAGNKLVGYAVRAKDAVAGKVYVRINN
jgi:predicted RecA/RadA family phage recombinase